MDFRAICNSGEQADEEYKHFASEEEAKAWASKAIKTDWGQIAIQKKSDAGEWESTPVEVYKADH
jgi:hypothetical protein